MVLLMPYLTIYTILVEVCDFIVLTVISSDNNVEHIHVIHSNLLILKKRIVT